MNETYTLLAEFAERPESEELYGQISSVLENQDNGVVLSVLVQLLVSTHLEICSQGGDSICEPCANAELTRLLQAIRQVSDEMIEDLPKESH